MGDNTTNHRTIIVDSVSIENLFPEDDPFIRSDGLGLPIGTKRPIGVKITFKAESSESASLTCMFSRRMMDPSWIADDRKEITNG